MRMRRMLGPALFVAFVPKPIRIIVYVAAMVFLIFALAGGH